LTVSGKLNIGWWWGQWLGNGLIKENYWEDKGLNLWKSSQQKQTTQTWLTLTAKFDSVFMKHYRKVKSAIKWFFVDPVTYTVM